MEEKIQSVSEAFSMQPVAWYVGQTIGKRKIGKIIEGQIFDTGDSFDVYIGYYEDLGKAFHIRKQCATVTYF